MTHRANDFRTQSVRAIREFTDRFVPKPIATILRKLLLDTSVGQKFVLRFAGGRDQDQSRVFSVKLPSGYPATSIHIRISIPKLPLRPQFAFSDHVCDEYGHATETVLATTVGGFAISHDLGETWKLTQVEDRRYKQYHIVHLKSVGCSEFLAQAIAEPWRPGIPRKVDNLVLNERGEVLAVSNIEGAPWHGCRSAGMANGTLMYAEYPYEDPNAVDRAPSRVLRSRDRGRTWEIVFECDGAQVRHFHFLQARPGKPGEWWLTSGDKPSESKIWVSKDDGDTWQELTSTFGDRVTIDGEKFPRTVFRLTDLFWEEGAVVWGTDDYLSRKQPALSGARMFRSPISSLAPSVTGQVKWPIRNIVDLGDYYLVLTQGCVRSDATVEERMPGVFLMPKKPIESAPGLVHLFDIDVFSTAKTGFTYSRASRAARKGIFFSFRASTDAFPFGHKILRWNVTIS
jgi:hypothetical protein